MSSSEPESPRLPEDEPPIREFADRGTIWLLGSSEMLREFLRIAGIQPADQLDFTRSVRLNRSLIPDDLQRRETDLLVQAPYQEDHRSVWIYVLVEHQSEPDPVIAWRVLSTMDRLWSQQEREFRDAGIGRASWRFRAMLPIVFYTGRRDWDPPAGMHELVDSPRGLEEFAPHHQILFVNLHEIDPDALTESATALGWVLRAFQAVDTPVEEFGRIVEDAVRFLESLPEEAEGEWSRAMHFLLLLIRHNRLQQERVELYERVMDGALRHRERMETMILTDAQSLLEEGRVEGRVEGHVEGRAREARELLLRLGSRRYGPPDESERTAIEAIVSVERLEALVEAVLDAPDWKSLLRSG